MELSKVRFLTALFCITFLSHALAQISVTEIQDPLSWKRLDNATPTEIKKGAFIGKHKDYLLVAGGSLSDQTFTEDIYVFGMDTEKWEKLEISLPQPMAFGSTVVLEDGILLIGGRTTSSVLREVYLLNQDISNTWTLTEINTLPIPLQKSGACLSDNKVYVAGGYTNLEKTTSDKFYQYDILKKTWETLPNAPLAIDANPSLVAQNEGESDAIFVHSQNDGNLLRYSPKSKMWKSLGSIPNQLKKSIGFKIGSSHIMYFDTNSESQGSTKDAYTAIYHTITDRWVTTKDTDLRPVQNGLVSVSGEKILATSEKGKLYFYVGTPKKDATGLSVLDIFTFCVYFLVLLYMGYRFSKRIKNTDDYFRGGKRVPAWAAGISIVATKLSAVTFMSIPAKVFATDWLYFLIPFNSIVLAYFVVKVVLPFFQRLNLTSAYQYLEVRFNVVIRILGSISYLLWEIGRVGVLLLLPAIVISLVTNVDLYFCIILIGFIATIYTLIGGIEAVIWTDVIQVFVMMLGILIALFIMVNRTDGDLLELYESASSQGKLKAFNWDLDLTRATVLVIVLGWVGRIQEYVSTQSIVQRFMTTKNEKAAAKSMWISALVSIPVVIVFYFVGTALFLYYQEFPQDLNPTMEQTDAILPTFFITQLPIGVIGLVIAAIFAAAMSSLDSAMNSMSTVIITDFYKRFKPKMSESKLFTIAKYLVGFLGVLGTASAILMASFEIKSLFDQLLLFMGLTGGGLAGMFLLGMLTNRASATGVLIGFVVSCLVQYLISFYTNFHFLLYSTTGLASCYFIGYLASLLFPDKNSKKEKLNIYMLNKR